MRGKTFFVIALTLALLPQVPAFGQQPTPETKTVTVAAFKNGLGFFVQQGKVKLTDGWGTISNVPSATFGSLWVAANDDGVSIDEVVASQQEIAKSRNTQSLIELLLANAGKVVTVTIRDKEVTGEILAIGGEKAVTPETPVPGTYYPVPPIQNDMLLMKIGGNVVAFRRSDVNSISFTGNPTTKLEGVQIEKIKRLKFKVKGAKDAANVTMGYLQKGFGWTPSYLITLLDEKTARITMQGVLINDVEDLTDTDVFLVVGFPNFTFSNILSPMALQQTLAEFMSSLQHSGDYTYRNNPLANVMSQRAEAYSGDREAGLDYSTTVNDLSGTTEEDLFLYNRQHVNLKKGERGTYNVFTSNVAYEHVYQWDIVDTSRIDSYGSVSSSAGQQPAGDQVWHSLCLTNSTNVPWTTAPAMVVSGTKPVAQDTLNYTSKGATGTLKLTVATDIRVDKQELEGDRQPNAKKRFGYDYDAVMVDGTLKVKNYKAKDVKLKIKKSVTGEMTLASDGGKAEKLAEAVKAVNPTSRIQWEIPLKAGEEKIITYKYKVYVRP